MDRRRLLKGAGLAAAATSVSAPAIAQSLPTIKWRLPTTFPKSLDTLYGACDMFANIVGELSEGKFQIGVFGPGEIVPPFQVLDAVANNTVEMGNTASYYYIGKDLAYAFGTAVPFGLNTRQMNAWLAYGGGMDLLNKELYVPAGVYGIPFGNTTAQMGGWFRKEIKTLDDLKGLNFRSSTRRSCQAHARWWPAISRRSMTRTTPRPSSGWSAPVHSSGPSRPKSSMRRTRRPPSFTPSFRPRARNSRSCMIP